MARHALGRNPRLRRDHAGFVPGIGMELKLQHGRKASLTPARRAENGRVAHSVTHPLIPFGASLLAILSGLLLRRAIPLPRFIKHDRGRLAPKGLLDSLGGGASIDGTGIARKSVVEGKRVSVRVGLGGRRTFKKKKEAQRWKN